MFFLSINLPFASNWTLSYLLTHALFLHDLLLPKLDQFWKETMGHIHWEKLGDIFKERFMGLDSRLSAKDSIIQVRLSQWGISGLRTKKSRAFWWMRWDRKKADKGWGLFLDFLNFDGIFCIYSKLLRSFLIFKPFNKDGCYGRITETPFFKKSGVLCLWCWTI